MSPLQWFPQRLVNIFTKHLTCAYLLKSSAMPHSMLSVSIVLGIVSITLLDTNFSSAIAQITILSEQNVNGNSTNSQANLLFVNSSIGNDGSGNGSQNAPLRTITQALRLAQPNTVIILAAGTYSSQSGEQFPLILQPGVSLQGDTSNKGKNVKIVGGGDYFSRSFGRKNIAILAANQSRLTGVTVTNKNPRGYGLWIESGNTLVTENTFVGNTQDGIIATGNATPTISKNHVYDNGANGITAAGSSRPQIQENIIQRTGFGINIAENAAPTIISNRISGNRSGVVIQANTQPVLRNNLIEASQEDGLVVIAQAKPDLGNSAEPGRNQFNRNRRYDINAKAAKQVVYAFGNQVNRSRIIGNVDIVSGKTVIRTVTNVSNSVPAGLSPQPVTQNGEIMFAPSNISPRFNSSGLILHNRNQQPQNNQAPQVAGTSLPRSLYQNNSRQTTNNQPIRQFNYVRISPGVVEVTVPESGIVEFVAPQLRQTQQTQQIRQNKLANKTNISNKSVVIGGLGTGSLPQRYAARTNARYRVVVNVVNNAQQDLVRSVVPDAFSKVVQGRRVMQAGIYNNEYNAMEMVQLLNSKGLNARISY